MVVIDANIESRDNLLDMKTVELYCSFRQNLDQHIRDDVLVTIFGMNHGGEAPEISIY